MTLSNTIRKCPYGHIHRDGTYRSFRKETKRVRVAQRRGLRAANRWRANRGLDHEEVRRTQGWISH